MEEEAINSYLTFSVNGNMFGVHVSKVVEILAYQEPKTHTSNLPYLIGLVEHRGQVLPLIDTGLKFGLDKININEQSYTVVVSVNGASGEFNVALAVDEVREVVDIPEENRQKIETTYKPGYVLFATQSENGLILVFDTDKVFSDTEVVSLSQINTTK